MSVYNNASTGDIKNKPPREDHIYFNNHKTGSERSDFVSFCKNQPSKKPEVIKIETSNWKIGYPDEKNHCAEHLPLLCA